MTTEAVAAHTAPRAALAADLAARLRAHWLLKFAGTIGFMAVFFGAYFLLLRFPVFPVRVMPLTAVDRVIAFQPWAIGLYFSLWPYVSLPPALLRSAREVRAYGWLATIVAAAGLAIFFLWPTKVPPVTGIEWSSHFGFSLLKRVDAAHNACPSLHVAFAVFSAVWFDRTLRTIPVGLWARAASALWCGGIVYSTIATRQHVAVDVAAGAALGLAVAILRPAALRWVGGAPPVG